MDMQELWTMEEKFWLDGPDFYGEAMAADARMVFPAPVGILEGNAILEGLRNAPRWDEVAFENRTETGTDDVAVLAYEATGSREGEEPYVAFCMSTYIRDGAAWKLLAHQQTPKG
ncbi:DUF4440 domain-containing protein [Hasllibacter sp. MH4015]|uniref:DUF4440 domain-containing protein n=1 Tax=Hasllibacter sp. MH4015 TaxID=2854029 RepID=UPI001CD7F5E9|nr:nuclear transport factor 2 family protein [Hasllibacter sp. MH4015]